MSYLGHLQTLYSTADHHLKKKKVDSIDFILQNICSYQAHEGDKIEESREIGEGVGVEYVPLRVIGSLDLFLTFTNFSFNINSTRVNFHINPREIEVNTTMMLGFLLLLLDLL